MAKRTVTTVETSDPPGSDDPQLAAVVKESLEDDGVTPEAELTAALDELGEGINSYKVRVYRYEPNAGACETYPASEFTIERVRAEYGAGKYRCTIIDHLNKVVRNKTVQVITKREVPGTSLVPIAPNTQLTDIAALLKEMRGEKSDSLLKWAALLSPIGLELVKQMFVARAAPPQIDPIAMQTSFVTQMVAMKDLFGSKSEGSQLDTFVKMMEVVKDVMPGGESGTSTMDLIAKGLDILKPVVGAIAANRGPAHPGPKPMVATVVPPVVVPSEPEEPTVDLSHLNWLKEQIESNVRHAASQRDPELYADVFIDQLPDSLDLEVLESTLRDDEWFARLSIVVPSVQPHEDWFSQFRLHVLRFCEEERDTQTRIPSGDLTPEDITNATVTRVPLRVVTPDRVMEGEEE